MLHRRSLTSLLVAGAVALSAPAFAQSAAPVPHHVRKAKPAKAAPQSLQGSGGLNQPSANFRDAEPPNDGTNGPQGPTSNVRPTIGENGNIGFGTGF